ncbi:MAG: hypothetical protein RLZZ383_2675 [Pseudomonadota bacterium]
MTGPRHTLDQLVVLDAIDRQGSFAAAAAALHRVPSAVSHAIKALEEGLGVTLFDRSGHKAVWTDAGRQLLVLAREQIVTAERLDAVAAAFAAGWEAELHVVVDGALPLADVTRALRAIAAAGAPTRVRLDVEAQDGVRDRFDAEHADVFVALELDQGRDGLEVQPLDALPFRLVVHPDHPVAAVAGITREALARHADVVVRDSSPKARGRRTFLGTASVIFLSDFVSKREALLAGLGFGWMPEHLVAADVSAGRLVPVDLEGGSTWTYTPHIGWRRGPGLGPAARCFVQALTSRHQ